jgi:hypothetical protein
MSSVQMTTFGCFISTSPSARNSARVYAAPVGLLGLFNMNSRVFGVIAASSCAGVIL